MAARRLFSPRSAAARGFTIVEMLVAITIFLALSALATMVFVNVRKAQQRTMSMIQLHTEAAAILQRIEEDLENAQPNVALNLTPNHLTFMRAHGEADGVQSLQRSFFEGNYRHDLIWVRWQWTDGLLRRAVTPPISLDSNIKMIQRGNSFDSLGSHGGNPQDGLTATAQQFYQYFEPPALPDRNDPGLSDSALATAVAAFTASLEGPYVRQLDTDIYWRPNKLWHHPGHAGGRNRGRPGSVSKIEFGQITTEATSGEDVTGISWNPEAAFYAAGADAPQVAFAVTNPKGYSVNRDFVFLLGVHPDNGFTEPYDTKLGVITDHLLNFRVYPLADSFAVGSVTRAISKSAHFSGDPVAGSGAFAGVPMNPSSDNDVTTGILEPGDKAKLLPEIMASIDVTSRPSKLEIAFVIHNIPRHEGDRYDLDADGDTIEPLALAVWSKVQADNASLDPNIPVDAAALDRALIRQLEQLTYIGVPFTHAVMLPY